ncbi:MAG: DNA-binding protein WhiA [Acholeplasmataceae bacterium]|nr:DNA-binding protein WhiA [Acholeplasmataceae bacterium]
MSFSSEVKKEIGLIQGEDCCIRAELYELIRLRSMVSISNRNFKITFTTTSLSTSRRIVYLIKKLYNVQVEILQKEQLRLDKKPLYYLVVTEKGKEILMDLDFINPDLTFNENMSTTLFQKECCKASLLRGAFLAKGSINNPISNKYHLEIVLNSQNEADFLKQIMEEIGIEAKTILRAKGVVLYLKRAEHIADFLKFIGAGNSLFTYEDLRIKKDLNNYVNRIMNCDVANEQKAIATASKQLADIAFLEKNYGFINLTPRLMDAVILRTTFPDDSLSQLSENSEETIGRFISKSGLSHCFQDISALVEEVKKNKPLSLKK